MRMNPAWAPSGRSWRCRTCCGRCSARTLDAVEQVQHLDLDLRRLRAAEAEVLDEHAVDVELTPASAASVIVRGALPKVNAGATENAAGLIQVAVGWSADARRSS